MKIFTKKSVTQKIILIVIIAILWNFVFPTFSRADLGGVLFNPISDFIMTIGDVVVALLQAFFYDGFNGKVINIFESDYSSIPEMSYTGKNVIKIDKLRLATGFIENAWTSLGGTSYKVPVIQYSVDKIFAGKVPAFDINFINPRAYTGHGAGSDVHIAAQISGVIASWYTSLRNLAIVILLSVLAYIGIRIVISSSADDRAKYKEKLLDWFIAMCLIFFMHYIMNFTISIVGIINDNIGKDLIRISFDISGEKFDTDLMGAVRLQAQYDDFASKVTFMIFYIALVVYTVKFSWVYLKRTVTMMFLTVIAPLVAMTYPIDKLGDGKSQAFDAWLKEYVFTALLQPFHLIIYSVLVGSAIDIVTTNPLFAILVIAFIGPAEKMLRKFFGFDKAPGASALSQAGNMFGGAAAWDITKKAIGAISSKVTGGGGAPSGNNNVRTANENTSSPAMIGDSALNQKDENTSAPRDNTDQQALEEGRAYLPPEEEREYQPQDQNDWDNMDAYLNPSAYSDGDFQSANEYATTHPEPTPPTQNSGDNRSILRKAGALAASPFTGAWRSLKNTASTKIGNGNWKRTLGNGAVGALKLAGRAAVAGTVGAIGVGMGIAGDDLDDVLKYGAAGAALGYSVAPRMGRAIANTDLAKSISTEANKAIYGSEEKANSARQARELRDSGRMREFAEKNFKDKDGNAPSGKELAALENRAIELHQKGFTNDIERKRVMDLDSKMMKELNGNLPEEDIKQRTELIGKMARDIKPEELSNEKYINQKIGEFEKAFKDSNLSGKEARSSAVDMMNNIKRYYGKEV